MKVSRRFRTWIFFALLFLNGVFLLFLQSDIRGVELWAGCIGSLILLAVVYLYTVKKPQLKAGKQKIHPQH